MYSEVGICNMALSNMGIGRVISKLTDATEEARTCRRFYEHARDELLREYPWNWAAGVSRLALRNETDPFGACVYAYPADALRICRVFSPDAPMARPNWHIRRAAGGGKAVVTDMERAWAEYTSRVTDPAEFPPLFADALSWLLAAKLTLPLKADGETRRGDVMQYYLLSKQNAVAADANEGLRSGVNVDAGLSAATDYLDVRR
ncbi:MAG: hypothetical protein ACOYD9_07385 [Pyramidobacter sp.]|jgi:hypothetical protein